LKEMLKYTHNDLGSEELQQALNTILGVLKYVNDIMHQVAITGYPGELSDLGKLLMQGSFNVWMEDKKTKIKDIRFKAMQRHVFLYEKRFLFCKKKDDVQSDSYIFKNELPTADVGLTENVKGDKKKFEVWRPARAQVYTCQGPSVDVKNTWVDVIKQVLMSQFDQIRSGKVKKEIPTVALPSTPTLQLVPVPKHYHMGGDTPSYQHDTPNYQSVKTLENTANNNHTPIPLGDSLDGPLDDTQSNIEANQAQNTVDQYEEAVLQDHAYSSDEYEEENSAQDSSFNSDSPHVQGLEFPGFIALADYPAMDPSELGLNEGDLVTVIKVGSAGWWYVRNLSNGDEGWSPASYLESAKRLSSQSTLSMSSTGKNLEEDLEV
jgi:hypothetical protein